MNKTQLFGECQLGESLAHDINGEDEKEVKDEWGRGDTLIFLSSCSEFGIFSMLGYCTKSKVRACFNFYHERK